MREGEHSHSLTVLAVWKCLNCLPSFSREDDYEPSYPPKVTATSYATSQPRPSSDHEFELRHRSQPRRPLSPTLPGDEGEDRETPIASPQTDSPLFKLPAEIRRMIYEPLLGGKVFHVIRRRGKLGHKECKAASSTGQCMSSSCRGFKLPTGIYVGSGDGGLLPILQSCRRLYSEGIETLYSQNVFDFDCLEAFLAFSCAIVPQRFDTIRRLSLKFRFDQAVFFAECTPRSNWPRWQRTWRVIASMVALQEIHVTVFWKDISRDAAEEARILEPLKLATGLQTFTVTLPYSRTWGELVGTDIPFHVLTMD